MTKKRRHDACFSLLRQISPFSTLLFKIGLWILATYSSITYILVDITVRYDPNAAHLFYGSAPEVILLSYILLLGGCMLINRHLQH